MATSNQPTLTTLPTELYLKLFKLLDPVSRTCLGLCTKKLYSIHTDLRGRRGPVPLQTYLILPPNRHSGMHLFELLEKWMKPYVFCVPTMKFVTEAMWRDWYQRRRGVSDEEWRGIEAMMDAQDKAEEWAGGHFESGRWREMDVDSD